VTLVYDLFSVAGEGGIMPSLCIISPHMKLDRCMVYWSNSLDQSAIVQSVCVDRSAFVLST